MESRSATANGWHRSFCFKVTRWRGTRELPGLMLALDRGGSCKGLAYRLPAQDHFGLLGLLLRRELDDKPSTNVPLWIAVKTEKGTVRALAFVAAPGGRAYVGKLPMEKVAHILARALLEAGVLPLNTCSRPYRNWKNMASAIVICGE